MKPPPLEYRRARSVDEAVALLGEYGDEAKLLAGGQSLVPMLNLRLARPAVLVDIGDLPLGSVDVGPEAVSFGALVRHRRLETDPVVANAVPLLAQVAPWIGHPAIRNRGTLGGSLAHADPTAELALATVALDARIGVVGPSGRRELPADGFFLGPFTTGLDPDELIVDVWVPRRVDGERHGFAELAERSGDFAVAAAACVLRPNGAGYRARVVVTGAGSTALRLPAVEESLTGFGPVDALDVATAGVAGLDLDADAHVGAEYRRHVLAVVVAEAVDRALDTRTAGGER